MCLLKQKYGIPQIAPSQNYYLPPGYEIIYKPHQEKHGGGVAVIARTELRFKLKIELEFTSFEAIIVTIISDQKVLNMCVVYAPKCKW